LKSYKQLSASLEIIDLKGKQLKSKSIVINVPANQLTYCFMAELPSELPANYMIRLILSEGNNVLSQNEYWRSTQENGNYDSFNHMAETRIVAKVVSQEKGKVSFIVSNPTKSPVIGLKFNLRNTESGKIILPANFSDGYFTLFPGEKKRMEVEWNSLSADKTEVVVEGYNLKTLSLLLAQ
jgi:hypothetical protein